MVSFFKGAMTQEGFLWDLILTTKESYKLFNYDWYVKLLEDQRIIMVQIKGR
jgi:hypothetical protein